jgi:hypothetical protein
LSRIKTNTRPYQFHRPNKIKISGNIYIQLNPNKMELQLNESLSKLRDIIWYREYRPSLKINYVIKVTEVTLREVKALVSLINSLTGWGHAVAYMIEE